ncbi:MAG: phosphate/phosphite/phosphonate ABC transporter substrate-binding protein [Caulobacter sp.]|jgi:phosphonate transport system substrate-binding protein|uniref:phosphate/phosphite/phosphonate ABC transporter substrate-binding protein n=1 Tax=Caulobacter sp. CCH9-E1 TaxID=1768768 RepID=UPI0008326CD0|nr:phosphate/phosphite/phosphonate ABC transporter substrate-binding protein [Caulobacter sp. CCH9-E1]MCK5908755.1 phosphate/phosphite/phosphonate ABC transporter substrate-binding protein [Caulobacter sp.]
MINRRSAIVIAAGLSALALASCGKAPQTPAAKDTITFSILSTESAQNMESYWKPILADMEKQTGLKVKPFFSSNYSSLIVAMGAKQTDVGWFSNQSGLEAVRRSNGEVFARTFDPSGTDGYKSVIIVPADSKIQSVQDLLKCDKSLNFGIGDKKSTSGTLAPMTYVFIPANKKPEECFKTVISANHQANLFAVANGKLDAATNNSTAIGLSKARGEGVTDKVRVIWQSPTLPEDPIVWRKDLDPAIKEKLRQFFLTYAQGDTPEAEQQRGYLKKLSIGGFKPADDSHLLVVREMEATEQLGLAREAGDQAKIAAAQKSLDQIKAERVAAEGKAGVASTPAN